MKRFIRVSSKHGVDSILSDYEEEVRQAASKRYLLIAGLPILLSGCATTPYNESAKYAPILEEARGGIASTRVLVGLDPANNSNLTAVTTGSASQYGLLGAMIETAIHRGMNVSRQDREKLMLPIQNAVIHFNFGSRYRAELEKSARSLGWLNTTSVFKEPSFQRQQVDSLLPQVSEDALLISDTFYKVASDFSKVTITSYVVLYPKNDRLVRLARTRFGDEPHPPLYRNKFTFEYAYESQYQGETQAAKGWGENDGAMVKRALEMGVAEVPKMVVYDLQTQVNDKKESSGNMAGASSAKYGNCTGTLVQDSTRRVMLRLQNGDLCTVSK